MGGRGRLRRGGGYDGRPSAPAQQLRGWERTKWTTTSEGGGGQQRQRRSSSGETDRRCVCRGGGSAGRGWLAAASQVLRAAEWGREEMVGGCGCSDSSPNSDVVALALTVGRHSAEVEVEGSAAAQGTGQRTSAAQPVLAQPLSLTPLTDVTAVTLAHPSLAHTHKAVQHSAAHHRAALTAHSVLLCPRSWPSAGGAAAAPPPPPLPSGSSCSSWPLSRRDLRRRWATAERGSMLLKATSACPPLSALSPSHLTRGR